MMTEKQLQAKILKAINKLPHVVAFAHVATIYTQTGHPDCYGCYGGGWAFFAEVKLPGKDLTKIQKEFLKKVRAKGATVFIWRSVEEAIEQISVGTDEEPY